MLLSLVSSPASITLDDYSFGYITPFPPFDTPVGSGFVVGTSPMIVTCNHVVADTARFKTNYLYGRGSDRIYADVMKTFPDLDLAILKPRKDGIKRLHSIPVGDVTRMRQGDLIYYLGWDSTNNTIKLSTTKVLSVDSFQTNGTKIDRVHFKSIAYPGYSGGPILNGTGEVVALIVGGSNVGEKLTYAYSVAPAVQWLATNNPATDPKRP